MSVENINPFQDVLVFENMLKTDKEKYSPRRHDGGICPRTGKEYSSNFLPEIKYGTNFCSECGCPLPRE